MSIYDNETKLYPDSNPMTPQVEPQTYQLSKLSEIEAFFLMKLMLAGGRPKKSKDSLKS